MVRKIFLKGTQKADNIPSEEVYLKKCIFSYKVNIFKRLMGKKLNLHQIGGKGVKISGCGGEEGGESSED